jgi:regulatory protein
MNLVALIVTQGENKAVIHFEDGRKLIVPKELVYQYGFRKGDEIGEEDFLILEKESQKLAARHAAFRFLALRAHSEFELYGKLLKKKYPKDIIRACIDELVNSGHLNDKDFARQYAVERLIIKQDGQNKVRAQLMNRGVKKEIIDVTLNEVMPQTDSESKITALAQKKIAVLKKRGLEGRGIKIKVTQFLISKGFEYSSVKETCDRLLNSEEESE